MDIVYRETTLSKCNTNRDKKLIKEDEPVSAQELLKKVTVKGEHIQIHKHTHSNLDNETLSL